MPRAVPKGSDNPFIVGQDVARENYPQQPGESDYDYSERQLERVNFKRTQVQGVSPLKRSNLSKFSKKSPTHVKGD